jgi:hypothetical protein
MRGEDGGGGDAGNNLAVGQEEEGVGGAWVCAETDSEFGLVFELAAGVVVLGVLEAFVAGDSDHAGAAEGEGRAWGYCAVKELGGRERCTLFGDGVVVGVSDGTEEKKAIPVGKVVGEASAGGISHVIDCLDIAFDPLGVVFRGREADADAKTAEGFSQASVHRFRIAMQILYPHAVGIVVGGDIEEDRARKITGGLGEGTCDIDVGGVFIDGIDGLSVATRGRLGEGDCIEGEGFPGARGRRGGRRWLRRSSKLSGSARDTGAPQKTIEVDVGWA